MLKKAALLTTEYFKSLTACERFEIVFLPVILSSILLACFFVFVPVGEQAKFANSFIESLQSIAAIMSAFGIAGVTIILTSSSKNIDRAKKSYVNDKNIRLKGISYFELVLIRCSYNTLFQIVLLGLVVLSSFLSAMLSSIYLLPLVVIILIHSLGVQLQVVITLYHMMWSDEVDDEFTFKG